jgi:hypothetical protein
MTDPVSEREPIEELAELVRERPRSKPNQSDVAYLKSVGEVYRVSVGEVEALMGQ